MKKNDYQIWIDLENTPHVPLFMPIKKELERRGLKVILTARDFAQTIQFLEKIEAPYQKIGRQFNGGKIKKIAGILWRSIQLTAFMRHYHVKAFLSHGSRSGIVSAACLRIPIVTMGDYEFSFTKLDNFFSHKIMRPEVTDRQTLIDSGLNIKKFIPYPGYKEQIYLSNFSPVENFRKQLHIREDDILVVLRSPATTAHYHNELSIDIMKAVLNHVLACRKTIIIALPRSNEEKQLLQVLSQDHKNRVVFPEKILDGLNLIWHADILISGGGTMNREAAMLGVPVYSIFTGQTGSVDKTLESEGRMKFVKNPEQVSKIKIVKKTHQKTFKPPGNKLVRFICDEIEQTIQI